MNKDPKKLWIKSLFQFIKLYLNKHDKSYKILGKTYNQIACEYDKTWTIHMQNLSREMIKKLSPKKGDMALDIACGTGFVTSILAEYTNTRVVGVDASDGMIKIAKENYGKKCEFIQSEMMNFISNQSSDIYDIITCAWGLGYTNPCKFFNEISRVLKKGGRVGIIDLSIFSNLEIYLLAIITIFENPDAISHYIKTNYLISNRTLNLRMRFNNLHILESWKSYKILNFKNAEDAVRQLLKTGTLAIFESSIKQEYKDWFKKRMIDLVKEKYEKKEIIPLKHHYIASIGVK
jgi:ubiquinone/menaquinone biosynthesis C-methylase UbiE